MADFARNFKFRGSTMDFHEEHKFMDIVNKSDKTPEEQAFYDKVLERTDVWITNPSGHEVKLNND